MRLGKEGGSGTALLRNQLTFGRVTRQEGIFVFGVAVDSISVHVKLEIANGVFP